jgi:hypothetical protein
MEDRGGDVSDLRHPPDLVVPICVVDTRDVRSPPSADSGLLEGRRSFLTTLPPPHLGIRRRHDQLCGGQQNRLE